MAIVAMVMAQVAMVMAQVVERSDGILFERVGFESQNKLGFFRKRCQYILAGHQTFTNIT